METLQLLLDRLRGSFSHWELNNVLLVVFSGGFLRYWSQIELPAWLFSSMHYYQQDLASIMTEWDAKLMEDFHGLHQLAETSIVSPLNKNAVVPKNERTGLCNFKHFSPKDAVQFQPSYGTHWVKYEGTCFTFSKKRGESNTESIQQSPSTDSVTLRCIGWWNQKLLQKATLDAIDWYNSKHQQVTKIFRPPLKLTRQKGHLSWVLMSTRPARKFDTVDIDPSKRDELLRDVSIYLDTGRQKWYSDRGIPYKRSFLFHGPFGVGKSTVASAIAGELGLDIYTLSLRSGDITEAELECFCLPYLQILWRGLIGI